jgi:hypothetical protein
MPRTALPIWLAILLGSAGCTPPERDRATVEGTASFKGQPLAGFHIALYSEQTGGGSAEVLDGGRFKFAGPIQDGEYVVSVVIPAETKGEARAKLEAMGVPRKYRRAESSDYKVTVQPGKNVLAIELKPE